MADDDYDAADQFEIKRIYIKDFSFEAPGGARTFTNPWSPGVSVEVEVSDEVLGDGVHEVVLTLTITVSNASSTAFMIEILQGGIFTCQGFEDNKLKRVLYTYCPNILFPYAREAVDNIVLKGGFPALMIEPVNFEALYMEHVGDG